MMFSLADSINKRCPQGIAYSCQACACAGWRWRTEKDADEFERKEVREASHAHEMERAYGDELRIAAIVARRRAEFDQWQPMRPMEPGEWMLEKKFETSPGRLGPLRGTFVATWSRRKEPSERVGYCGASGECR